MKRICKLCGYVNREEGEFCPECGEPYSEDRVKYDRYVMQEVYGPGPFAEDTEEEIIDSQVYEDYGPPHYFGFDDDES